MTLRLALVGGPMYDGLYPMLDGIDAEVVVHADHPTLNRTVESMLRRGERIDVLSTHSKYAPSQSQWLTALELFLDEEVLRRLAPRAVDLCRFGGALLSVPRNIDVRVLWANRSLLGRSAVPVTWEDLVSSPLTFAFPGRESGLFGTFFEIVSGLGGQLFDPRLRPTLSSTEGRRAVATLVALAGRGPADLPDWHYDQVDAALGSGRVALAAAWPGATQALRASAAGRALEPHVYLSGPHGLRSYAGCHSWAIPSTCGDVEAAVRVVRRLCSAEAHALEAESGAVCADVAVYDAVKPLDEIDARRRAVTRLTIAEGMITYPPLARFPEIEDAGWQALHHALRGAIDADAALAEMQAAAEEVLG